MWEQVIDSGQTRASGLALPPKLDSMHGGDYIDNLTIIVQVDEDTMTSGAFGSQKGRLGK